MCLGIPGQIVEVVDAANHIAMATVSDAERHVNIAMVEADGIAPGDWIVVHAGFALNKIDEREARQILAVLQELSDAYADETGGEPIGVG